MSLLNRISSLADTGKGRAILLGTAALALIVATYMAWGYAPAAKGETHSYRIIYFHVPSAIMSYLGFFIVFLGGVLYLWKKDLKFDRWATAGADLGVHFAALMIVTGMIWGKQRWGTWWLWEPRLTTAMILLIIFSGYLILRKVVENDITRAKYAAVYGIIGFLDVPLVHYAIKIWGSIMHPTVIDKSGGGGGMSPAMETALRVNMFLFLLLFACFYLVRLRVEKIRAEASRLRAEARED